MGASTYNKSVHNAQIIAWSACLLMHRQCHRNKLRFSCLPVTLLKHHELNNTMHTTGEAAMPHSRTFQITVSPKQTPCPASIVKAAVARRLAHRLQYVSLETSHFGLLLPCYLGKPFNHPKNPTHSSKHSKQENRRGTSTKPRSRGANPGNPF